MYIKSKMYKEATFSLFHSDYIILYDLNKKELLEICKRIKNISKEK